MTSEKSYATEQRLNALFNSLGSMATFTPDSSWTDTGTLTNSWTKGTSGFIRYKAVLPFVTAVIAVALAPGTVADGTLVCSGANGLPTGYRPTTTNQSIVADTNALKVSPVSGTSFENARLTFNTDGSITCNGFSTAATYCNCAGLVFTDI